jgi:multidrug resistance efflux pump
LKDDDPNAQLSEQQQLELFQKKYNFKSQAEAAAKLQQIKEERKVLRAKLDTFQKNFEQVHNRKIRYTKDIVSVQSEFKRYKDLKVDASQIEKFLKTLPK